MKRFLKVTNNLGDRQQTIKKYVLVNDQPQEVSHDSSQVQVSTKAISSQSKQGGVCGTDHENKRLIQAQTVTTSRAAHYYCKEKLIRDRAWIKHAYLQGTVPQNQLDDDTRNTDTVSKAEKSKWQIETKTDTALITKKLPTSIPHKKSCGVGMQLHSSKMDAAERSTDDENIVAKLKAKFTACQKENSEASAAEFNESTDVYAKNEFECLRSKSSATVAVTAVESMKGISMEDHSISNGVFLEYKEVPNQISDELEFISSEHKSFTECQGRICSGTERSLTKALTKQASVQGSLSKEKESVKMEHHHSPQCRNDKSKLALPLKFDDTSNANEKFTTKQISKDKFKAELGEKPNTWRELASANELTREGKVASIPLNESSDTARTKDSVEERSLEDKSMNKREYVGSQTSKLKSTEQKVHNRSAVMEMVTLKYPHQSPHMNEYSDRHVQLHSDSKSISINEVHSTTQKDKNSTFVVKMHDMGESKGESKRQLPRRDNLKVKTVKAETAVKPIKSKPSSSTIVNERKYKRDTKNEAKILDCEPVITHTHVIDRQRGWNTKQNSAKVNDLGPDSIAQNVGARKENKETIWQPSSKVSSTNTFKEDSVTQKWNERGNHKHEVHQDKFNGHAQVIACRYQDNLQQFLNAESEPEIPERGYLEDIDFVVNEFDMIFRTNPELPARAYLEDTDFVSKEFDLFFKRNQEKQKAESMCGNGASTSETPKFVLDSEANESPILNSDDTTGDQNGATMSVSNTYPCDRYQPLLFSQPSNPGDVYVNHSLLEAPHTSTSQWATDSSEGQYQPLITRQQDPRSRYDLVAFKPFTRPLRSSLQKILKDEQDIDAAIKSTPHPRDGFIGEAINSHINFQSPNTSDCSPISDHYQPLSSMKRDKDPVYVGLNINPQQPCTSEVSASNATDLGEGPYQALLFNRHKGPEANQYTPLTPLTFSMYTEMEKPDAYSSNKRSTRSIQFPSISTSKKSHGKCQKAGDSLKVHSAQEELHGQYGHKPPLHNGQSPPKDSLASPLASNEEDMFVINPRDESDKAHRSDISTIHHYEEISPMKSKETSATTRKFKSKEELQKPYRHRAPPEVPTITSSKEGILSDTQPSEPIAHKPHRESIPEERIIQLAESENELPDAQCQLSSDSMKAIPDTTDRGEDKKINAEIQQASLFVQEDQPISYMHQLLHSTAENSSSHLLSASDSENDYMPLIPPKKKKKANSDYETLHFEQ